MKLFSKPYLIIFATVLALIIFYSCKNEKVDPAKDNVVGSSCDTSNVTFSKVVKPILQSNCYGCHSTEKHVAFGSGIDLEKFEDLTGNYADAVVESIKKPSGTKGAMPPSGKMNACSISQIEKWYKIGAPNN